MSGSDASVKFSLSKDHVGYFKSAFAKDLINNKSNNMYNSSVSLLNSDDMDIVSDSEEIHVQFGLQKTSNSFLWQKQVCFIIFVLWLYIFRIMYLLCL